MAGSQGICSPFSLQPSARSPKLRLYETLFLWNQGVDQLVALLRGMEKFPFARKSALQCAQAGIEEVRADVNADFLEEQAEYELDDAGRFLEEAPRLRKGTAKTLTIIYQRSAPRGRTQKAGIAATDRHCPLPSSGRRRKTHRGGTRAEETAPQQAPEAHGERQECSPGEEP